MLHFIFYILIFIFHIRPPSLADPVDIDIQIGLPAKTSGSKCKNPPGKISLNFIKYFDMLPHQFHFVNLKFFYCTVLRYFKVLLINKDNNNNGETINVREEEPGQHKQNEKEKKVGEWQQCRPVDNNGHWESDHEDCQQTTEATNCLQWEMKVRKLES